MTPAAQPLAIAAIGLAWLGVAAVATLRARGDRRAALRAAAAADDAHELLAVAPAAPCTIDGDGRLSLDARVPAWLGLGTAPATLDELCGRGFDVDAGMHLREAVNRGLATGAAFSLEVAARAGGRWLRVHGAPMRAEAARRAMLLWDADITEEHGAAARTLGESIAVAALAAKLTALADATPTPMWTRDANGILDFVNLAYVRAVEAPARRDVVAHQVELFDRRGAGVGTTADADGRIYPAIVAGQRRLMRCLERPAADGGRLGAAFDVQALEDARIDLRAFEAAQRALLDRLSAAIVRFAPDRTLSFHNEHFARAFAVRTDALRDRPEFDRVLDRMHEAGCVPETRDFRVWREARRHWFDAPEAVEENWALRGGRHIHVVAQPLPDGGLIVSFEDRTEQMRLAGERDVLLRVRAELLENLDDPVAIFSAAGRLQLWNARFAAVSCLRVEDLARHPHVDALVDACRPCLATGQEPGTLRHMVRAATAGHDSRRAILLLADGREVGLAAAPLPDGSAMLVIRGA